MAHDAHSIAGTPDLEKEAAADAFDALRRGAPEALDTLMPLLYRELKRIAHRQLAGESPGHTLSTTAVVHEAYLRLARWYCLLLSVLPPVERGISIWLYRHICQDVCPWNERFARELKVPEFAPRPAIAGKDARTLAEELLAMSQAEFSAAFKDSPMKRAKLRGLKRNAAVVLGNVAQRGALALGFAFTFAARTARPGRRPGGLPRRPATHTSHARRCLRSRRSAPRRCRASTSAAPHRVRR